MSLQQILLAHRHLREYEEDRLELQARLVWAVAGGWKRPVKMGEGGDEVLKGMGIMEDAV